MPSKKSASAKGKKVKKVIMATPSKSASSAVKKPVQPVRQNGRGLKRANSVGSANSNSDSEDEKTKATAEKAVPQSADAQAAVEGQQVNRKRHGKHLRRKQRQRAKLAECAQEAFAKASVKAMMGPVRKPQAEATKSTGRKKTKAEYKAEHIQRLRQGASYIDNSYLK